MHRSTFARLAAACHPSVPDEVAKPALGAAVLALRNLPTIDMATARALVRAVLDAGSDSLAAEALAALPTRTAGQRQLPISRFTESVTDSVAAAWEGPAPSGDAAQLWLWANNLDGGNGFVLLCQTGAGGATDSVTSPMRLAIALAALDGLDWSIPTGAPGPLLQLLRWRLSGLEAGLVEAIAPIDARLATLPDTLWLQAWKAETSVLALPILKGFAMGTHLSKAVVGANLGHARKNAIANAMPTTTHGVLALFRDLPERAVYEAMGLGDRVATLRAVMGTTEQIKDLSWRHKVHSPEAEAKRVARAGKAAAAAQPDSPL
jgi:hypothetical protein